MRSAVVYERQGTLFIRTTSQTRDGLDFDEGPCFSPPLSAAPEELGRAVLQALAASRADVPKHPPAEELGAPVLRAAKVRSWSAFNKGARCVMVSQGEELRLLPLHNQGPRGGFVPVPGEPLRLPATAGEAQVGQGLLAALERST